MLCAIAKPPAMMLGAGDALFLLQIPLQKVARYFGDETFSFLAYEDKLVHTSLFRFDMVLAEGVGELETLYEGVRDLADEQ